MGPAMSRSTVFLSLLLPALASAAAPVGALSGARVGVGVGPGDQTDPHVSGSRVVYTHQHQGASEIRYHDLTTGESQSIPTWGAYDFLADVSGVMVVFTRFTQHGRLYLVDLGQSPVAPLELAPRPGAHRQDPALGGKVVAWQDFGYLPESQGSELVAYSLSTERLTRLTEDGRVDGDPAVSPEGEVVVWSKCGLEGSGCDIWQAQAEQGGYRVRPLTGAGAEEQQPDTNGEVVVYVRQVRGSAGLEQDIAWQPVGGGPERRLVLPGLESHPSVSGPLLAFEHRPPGGSGSDLYVYDLRTQVLYRLTQTPESETLSDVSVSADGQVRVVWAALERGDFNVYAYSFAMPEPGCRPGEDEAEEEPEEVCRNPGARPLLGTLQLVRASGQPDRLEVDFAAAAGSEGVLCVDNGYGGTPGTAGWVWLNGQRLVDPSCFQHDTALLAMEVELERVNTLNARIAGQAGSAFQVRVYGPRPACTRVPGALPLPGEPLAPVTSAPLAPGEGGGEYFIPEGDEGSPPEDAPPEDPSTEVPGGEVSDPGDEAGDEVSEDPTDASPGPEEEVVVSPGGLQGGCSAGGGGLGVLGLLLLLGPCSRGNALRRSRSMRGS